MGLPTTTRLPVGAFPDGVAVTPDGKRVYVVNIGSNNVSVIDTGSNTVVATVAAVAPGLPHVVAVTPDGKYAYVTNSRNPSGTVSVIDTASNTVVGTPIQVGGDPIGIAITPDGKHAYVTNNNDGTVSVIDTASNTVVGTPIPVGNGPIAVGIIPDVPFLAFSAALEIHFGSKPNTDVFALESSFTLSSTAPAINPLTQPVTLQVGPFATTIPPGSFKKIGGSFIFAGVINGVSLQALIAPTDTLRYAFLAAAEHSNLTGTTSPVTVRLSILDDSDTKSVKALIFH